MTEQRTQKGTSSARQTKEAPFFSVIVPVYNVVPYLGECLDSVLAQTFADWECLCTDDGSQDDSDRLLDTYARCDPRFRVVHQPNAGVSAARNRALDRLRGQWIWFVDGDDCLLTKTVLDILHNVVVDASANIVVDFGFIQGGNLSWRNEGNEGIGSILDKVYNDIPRVEEVKDYLWHMRLSVVWHMLWGRGTVSDLRFSPYSLSEDTLFAHEATLKAEKVIRIDFPTYFYRTHAEATTSTIDYRKVLDRTRALKQLFRILYERGYKQYLIYLIDREWCVQGLLWLAKIPKDEEYVHSVRGWMEQGRIVCSMYPTCRLLMVNAWYRLFGAVGIKVLTYFLSYAIRLRRR